MVSNANQFSRIFSCLAKKWFRLGPPGISIVPIVFEVQNFAAAQMTKVQYTPGRKPPGCDDYPGLQLNYYVQNQLFTE
jgi:hypothetical protein